MKVFLSHPTDYGVGVMSVQLSSVPGESTSPVPLLATSSDLGRGVVVLGPQPAPRQFGAFEFEEGERIVLDDSIFFDARPVAARLHELWLKRVPVVVQLDVDPGKLRGPHVESRQPYELDADYELALDRLQFLVWANNYDARSGEPIWWWARKAQRAFPGQVEIGGPADVVIDGVPVWCDGGPRQASFSAFPAPPVPDAFGVLHANAIEAGRLALDHSGLAGNRLDLAADQLASVHHDVGPARIIAPAGSGKTRVLTERLRHLVIDRKWEQRSILALAYNKRAADEMAQRTSDLGVAIKTLNAVGFAICNGASGFATPNSRVGRPSLTVIEEFEVRRLLDQLVDLKHAPNTDPCAPYLEALRAVRLALIAPEEAEVDYEAPGLSAFFDQYMALLQERNQIDFDGQVYGAIQVLLNDPNARAVAQRRVKHLLVDEFQDVTPAHLLLVRLLAAPSYDVFAVGDDDQVIYGFAGATPRYLVDYAKLFPGAGEHALEINYRCPASVVRAAANLLSYNEFRVTKTIRSSRESADDALVVENVLATEQAPTAVEIIRRWLSEGTALVDIAVLTRVNSTLLPMQVLLSEAGLSCRHALNESVLERTGMRTAFAYLRIGQNLEQIRRSDLLEVIRRPSRKISRNVIEMLTKRSTTNLRSIRSLSDRLTGSDAGKLVVFANDLERVGRSVRNGDVAATLRLIRVQIGLGETMDVLSGSRRDIDRSTHGDDLLALEQAAALHRDPETFEAWLRDRLRPPENPPSEPGSDWPDSTDGTTQNGRIELSTVHRVKGKEWPKVIVFGVDDGLFPHRLSLDESEERRLLHVAITRCQERCVVLASSEQPSPMLAELDGSRERRPFKVRATTDGYVGEPVTRAKRSPSKPTADVDVDPPPKVLVDALKSWRAEAAKRAGVSAFIVLSNKEIDNVARAAPRTLEELARCKGIGATRLERWGDEMLAVLEEAAEAIR